MGDVIFPASTLSENFRPSMFRAVEGQPAALDQHPAANDVVDHQQQEPDSNGGFQPCQQRLGGGQITDRRRQYGD